MNLRKYPGFQLNLLNNSSLKTLSIEQQLRRTLLAPEYQALTESSDVRVTIFCPGLSRNADLAPIIEQVFNIVMMPTTE